MKKSPLEKLMWSIAIPGFGQFLNKKYFKGVILILLEFLINVQAKFNLIIVYSFHGRINDAIEYADYQWLMFYPCLYFFSIWDAVRDAGGGEDLYDFFPYVFAAFSVTLGVIFSPDFTIFGVLLGPVWLPMLFVIPGVICGLIIRKILKII